LIEVVGEKSSASSCKGDKANHKKKLAREQTGEDKKDEEDKLKI
jgi:hypothetical protein